MVFNVRTEQGNIIFEVEGEISIYNIVKLKEAVELVREKGATRLVFDLSRVEYVDSTAIKFFLTLTKELASQQGGLALAGANKEIQETFRITRVDKFLSLFGDVPLALTGTMATT